MAIHTVPTELLCRIFAATLPQDEDVTRPISAYHSPLLVSWVSKEWRNVAISDQRLWSTIGVKISLSAKTLDYDGIIRLFLQRSGSQPLTLFIKGDQADYHITSKYFINCLAKQSSRWKRLYFIMPALHSIFQALLPIHAPNLTHLSFQFISCSGPDVAWNETLARRLNGFLRGTKSLTHVEWINRASWGAWDKPFDTGVDHLAFSHCHLTHLVLREWASTKSINDVLQRCPSLSSVEVYLRSDPLSTSLSSGSTPPRLHHLQSFSIYQRTLDPALQSLFDDITCPDLRHFSFACGFIDQVKWPQASFHSFLDRSTCQLEGLLLEFTGIDEPQLIQCLQQCTDSLTSLEVIDARGDICAGDTLLGMLKCRNTPFGSCATLCPKLHTLNLTQVIDCTDGVVAELLHSRTEESIKQHGCPQCVPLQESVIKFSKRYLQQNRTDLQALSRRAQSSLTH